MSYVSGELYWTGINNIPKKHPYLSNDIECQVAVVGAGITGAICSYYFCEAGIDTVIIDKNIAGYGSTSASTSILQYEIDSDLTGLKGIVGIDHAVKCFKLCEKAVYDIQDIVNKLNDRCNFSLKPCLYYSIEF
jgi:heterodisulfide reductase subunit A-like polyferredoxin